MLPDRFIAWFRKSMEPLARLLINTPLTPNALTVIGFLLNVGVAVVVATGQMRIGGLLILGAGLFDTLDGALARATHRSTKFGAFLDSTLDRFSEAALLMGLLIYYTGMSASEEIILIYAVFVGSIMVSYVRARAEGLGLKCEVGLMARPERVILLAAGLMLGEMTLFGVMVDWTKVVLWGLAIFANLTAVQRIFHVWHETSKGSAGEQQTQTGSAEKEKDDKPKANPGKHRTRPRWSE